MGAMTVLLVRCAVGQLFQLAQVVTIVIIALIVLVVYTYTLNLETEKPIVVVSWTRWGYGLERMESGQSSIVAADVDI